MKANVRPTRKKYSHKIANMRKEERRFEAEFRQECRDKMTDREQLEYLIRCGHRALKEKARLLKRINFAHITK